jgi:glycolate oxidase FAD binding subunit
VGTAAGVSGSRKAWTPGTTAEVQEAVHEAAARRTPLRIVGRGTWLDAGRPVAVDARPLHLDALSGITQYTPGDLTLTARAGTTLADIADATAAEDQWLALDPFATADHGGTVGATFATASAGPLAHALGLPRDLALGVEIVTGGGEVVRAGGRVVKNVAGFDITRLQTGAWGTLGVITEITVRLRARPEVDETVAVTRHGSGDQAADIAAALSRAPVAPMAAELLNPALAAHLGLDASGAPVLLLRLGGNAELVAAERAAIDALGDAVAVDGRVWAALRRCEPPEAGGAAVVRWSQLPTRVGQTWGHAVRVCDSHPNALIHASLARGVVRAAIPCTDTAALARTLRADRTAAPPHGDAVAPVRVAERLPERLWPAEAPSAVRDDLSCRVRLAFDPFHVLNPGLLGEAVGHE